MHTEQGAEKVFPGMQVISLISRTHFTSHNRNASSSLQMQQNEQDAHQNIIFIDDSCLQTLRGTVQTNEERWRCGIDDSLKQPVRHNRSDRSVYKVLRVP